MSMVVMCDVCGKTSEADDITATGLLFAMPKGWLMNRNYATGLVAHACSDSCKDLFNEREQPFIRIENVQEAS